MYDLLNEQAGHQLYPVCTKYSVPFDYLDGAYIYFSPVVSSYLPGGHINQWWALYICSLLFVNNFLLVVYTNTQLVYFIQW